MEEILKVVNLNKKYSGKLVVKDFNIDLHKGEIVGFVGPNGAGKSTTIRGILGYINIDSGSIEIFGQPVNINNVFEVNDRIGFLPSDNNYLGNYTPKEFFRYAAELLDSEAALKNSLGLAKELDLDINKQIKHLSYGNQKKVGFIHSIMHNPKLVIMDEPTAGLDPFMQKKIKDKITELAKNGSAIFLSSHNLNEVQEICTRIIMIKNGEIIIEDTTENLIKLANKIVTLINPPESLKRDVAKQFKNATILELNEDLRIELQDSQEMIKYLASKKFYNFFVERPSIENSFFDKYK